MLFLLFGCYFFICTDTQSFIFSFERVWRCAFSRSYYFLSSFGRVCISPRDEPSSSWSCVRTGVIPTGDVDPAGKKERKREAAQNFTPGFGNVSESPLLQNICCMTDSGRWHGTFGQSENPMVRQTDSPSSK